MLPTWFRIVALSIPLFGTCGTAAAGGELGAYQRITSSYLGYALQFRIYRPAGVHPERTVPTLYVTDGHAYLEHGDIKSILDVAIESGKIRPLLVVFLDSRNPDDLGENRRDRQFMCNGDFAKFFAAELVPAVSTDRTVSLSRDDRAILGFSFGGLNSACFGLMLSELFSGVAMQSPASGDHLDVVRSLYEERDALPVKIFLSVGTQNDNLPAARRFKRTLENKGYDLTYITVREGHDWKNWGPLIDDVLMTFFARSEPTE